MKPPEYRKLSGCAECYCMTRFGMQMKCMKYKYYVDMGYICDGYEEVNP